MKKLLILIIFVFTLSLSAQIQVKEINKKTFTVNRIIKRYTKKNGMNVYKYWNKNNIPTIGKMGYNTPYIYNGYNIYTNKRKSKYFYYIFEPKKVIIVFLKLQL